MTWTCSREQALEILKTHVKADHLIRHALTVEAVMRYFAELYGEDVEKWGIIGLLHDIDFEKYPEQHCQKVRELLSPYGFQEEYMRAIESHGYGIVNDVEPMARMEKVLFATDELTGLIAATALMRPSRSILDLEVSSVKKKWKQKGFAAGVDREVVKKGAEMLGIELDELIDHTIKGMRTVAEEIGLKCEL
ncbi:MAG: HDIG domain-containing protein [Christensenellaceae bacterium]|nr:HDIG domain-containing protein [Christensenellaceae bacterium]